jgi:hypothetical protein
MSRLIGVLSAVLATLALCAPLAAAHSYDPGGAPKIDSRSAGAVGETGALLRADIDPNADDDWWRYDYFNTSYFFQIGPTSAYGVTTTTGSLASWQDKSTVAIPVAGLTPGTTYNFHAVASNGAGTTYGPNKTFKTLGTAPSSGSGNSGKESDSGKGTGKGKGKRKGKKGMPDVEGEPELGHSVAAAVTTGSVSVRVQGSNEYRELSEGEMIPLDSTFDTTAGTMLLEAAGSDGKTYTGAFHGGQFTVHQSATGKGATTLKLRGGDFSACGSSRKGRATASSAHPVLRKLWGKDHGGRFKTSSRGSVATVRGTEWLTADRCDGTLTRVTHGKVLVRERGTGRSKLLRKGEKFFAHFPH